MESSLPPDEASPPSGERFRIDSIEVDGPDDSETLVFQTGHLRIPNLLRLLEWDPELYWEPDGSSRCGLAPF